MILGCATHAARTSAARGRKGHATLSLMPLRFACLLAFAGALVACSSSDDSSGNPPAQVVVYDAGVTKLEGGAPCATSNDCASGLTCLYPQSSCDAFRVCVAAPAAPCPQATTVCSCIGHTIQACAGFADEPIDHDGACADSGTIVPVDSGGGDDQAAPPVDASDAASE